MSKQRFKRWSVMPLLLISLLVILSACGKAPSVQSGEQPQSTAKPAAESAGETVAYTADNGVIQVPKNPKRIVVIADSYVGHFLALGIKPAGIRAMSMENPYFKEKIDGIENIGDGSSVEKLVEVKPDLIIVFTGATNLDKLEKIAPTVAMEYGKKTYREQLLEFGKLTNTENKAKDWIASWDKKIADNKAKVQAAVGNKTVSILNPYAKGLYVFGHNYGRGGEIIYGEFQLKAPPEAQKAAIDTGKGWAAISLETMPEFAGDYIFTSPWSGDTADPKIVYDSAIWKGLPAVKNNRVFQMEPKGAFYNDPISLEAMLPFIVEKLTQK